MLVDLFPPTIEATEALPPIAPPIPADSTASLAISAPFSQAGSGSYDCSKVKKILALNARIFLV
ncbi:hypothetical protein C6H69_08710 [Photorhabdus luminescens]|nr:hypothetical protein C6H69_08710 [Photorhabdus luminescens]